MWTRWADGEGPGVSPRGAFPRGAMPASCPRGLGRFGEGARGRGGPAVARVGRQLTRRTWADRRGRWGCPWPVPNRDPGVSPLAPRGDA